MAKLGETLYIGMPHRGQFDALPEKVRASFNQPCLGDDVWIAHGRANSSEAGWNYNKLWAEALNCQINDGVDWWIMLHDDVYVQPGFADALIALAKKYNADMLSVVLPLRDSDSGVTSTAIESENPWSPPRLTMHEVYARPQTWTEPGLLLNTGCMICKFTSPVWKDYCFRIYHRINTHRDKTGRVLHRAEVMAEDWNMSRWVHERGGRCFATTAVSAYHGSPEYHNRYAWGTWKTEQHGQKPHAA